MNILNPSLPRLITYRVRSGKRVLGVVGTKCQMGRNYEVRFSK